MPTMRDLPDQMRDHVARLHSNDLGEMPREVFDALDYAAEWLRDQIKESDMTPHPFELPDGTVVEIEFRDRSVGCVYAHGLHGYTHGPEKNDATSMVQWGDVRVLRVMAPIPERMDIREARDVLAKADRLRDEGVATAMAEATLLARHGLRLQNVGDAERNKWIDAAHAALAAQREWEARP